ncbi:hypothetical protein ACKVWC_008082 [Pyricularia oryzae]
MVANTDVIAPEGSTNQQHNHGGESEKPPSARAISDGRLPDGASEFAKQSEKLSLQKSGGSVKDDNPAVEARFVSPQDTVLVTSNGDRLPGVPLEEAHRLNELNQGLNGGKKADASGSVADNSAGEKAASGAGPDASPNEKGEVAVPLDERSANTKNAKSIQESTQGNLTKSMPPSHTNPLFPPLPLYGPPSLMRNLQCTTFRVSSFFLSLGFLGVIVLGSLFTSIPPFCSRAFKYMLLKNPDAERPFYEEEKRRASVRKELERRWRRRGSPDRTPQDAENRDGDGYIPTEGGPDPIKCDVGYYARRVGLDVEEFEVQTEDGFIIDLWHVYDPREYEELEPKQRKERGPEVFTGAKRKLRNPDGPKRFPVLLMHGLLQSAGAYCVNDDDSLAFYLCKSGYDVWLGNNRCGFKPKHTLLKYSDPRMWCWNIRQMGVFDLTALTSRVQFETGFEKIGLVCHSQGTTQTFVALAKEQRPDLGEKLSVFCALAPAAYAGPLIGKMYFKFMRIITPSMFRLMFGIHAFIPFMMTMHSVINPRIYGKLGYKVFSFLFNWTDTRWDRGLRDRFFQFAPVYVSAESMRWWLGRECFANHKCILATKEEWKAEEEEDKHNEETDAQQQQASTGPGEDPPQRWPSNLLLDPENVDPKNIHSPSPSPSPDPEAGTDEHHQTMQQRRRPLGATAWYNKQAPTFAFWVCGRDDLVDGRKLLRRFERGREPHVNVVHSRVLDEYEHLDVIWAMDAPDRVFSEVREVLWKTCNVRDRCRVPKGCEEVAPWSPAGEARGVDQPSYGGGQGEDNEFSGSSSEDLSA